MQQIVCIAVVRLAYLLPKLCTAQEKIPLETVRTMLTAIFYECCLFYFCFCVIFMMQPYGVFFVTPFTIE